MAEPLFDVQQSRLHALGQFAGGIVHDFNNILAIILGFAELALPAAVSERQRIQLQAVVTATLRGRDLVKYLLAFCRDEPTGLVRLPLGPTVEAALPLLRALVPSTVALEVNLATDLALILGTVTGINEVLLNLVSNAVYAMRETGGSLSVRLDGPILGSRLRGYRPTPWDHEPYLRLSIGDTGEGMTQAQRQRLFMPFVTSKPPGEGLGLGLIVVQRLVQSWGGALRVTSALGEGTQVCLAFPRQLPGLAASGVVDYSTTALKGNGGHHVLFVDDEPLICLWAEDLLTTLGYVPRIFAMPCRALASFEADPQWPDVLVTDQTMPMLTGEALIAAMRRRRPTLPAILCTGYSPQIDLQALQGTVFCYKPLQLQEFAAVLQRILHQPPS